MWSRLPVSGSSCSELGSCHPNNSKNLNRLKNQQVFLDHKREEDTSSYFPQDGWGRWANTDNHSLQEHRHRAETPAEPSARQENLNCNWWVAGDSLWKSLRVKRGSSRRAAPQFCEIYSRSLTRMCKANEKHLVECSGKWLLGVWALMMGTGEQSRGDRLWVH